jgi:hypothetical protein
LDETETAFCFIRFFAEEIVVVERSETDDRRIEAL